MIHTCTCTHTNTVSTHTHNHMQPHTSVMQPHTSVCVPCTHKNAYTNRCTHTLTNTPLHTHACIQIHRSHTEYMKAEKTEHQGLNIWTTSNMGCVLRWASARYHRLSYSISTVLLSRSLLPWPLSCRSVASQHRILVTMAIGPEAFAAFAVC